MNSEQTQRLLEEWFKSRDTAPGDVRRSARQVMSRTPTVRQRGRWWPLPTFETIAKPPRTDDATDYQSEPIPATNGRAPTATGRTRSMFSAVKAITAGALVFALGGMLLIAQPFDQQGGGVPGAATDVEWAAPVEVTGTRDAGGCSNGETFRRGSRGGSDVEATRGFTCSPRWSMSDPRLEGTVTFVSNEDIYHEGSGLEIGASAISIENDEGVWRQRPTLFIGFPDQTEVSTDVEMLVLDGEGAYEGMVAVIEYLIAEDGGDDLHPQRLHGFIIDGELPPAPENASVK